jgi:hypothetical protein
MKALQRISERLTNFRSWRLAVDFWTGVFFAAIIYDFFRENFIADSQIMIAIATIYVAILAFYSAEKEFRRWHHMHTSMHPGEAYVLIWTVFIVLLISAQAFLHLDYHMPPEVSASYIAVVSILALTRESKNWYKKKDKK